MPSDYITQLPMLKRFFDDYSNTHSNAFPGASQIQYDTVLLHTHQYLNAHVHPTVQQRSPLVDSGIYLTDHGPKHIEVVMKRASQLIQTIESARTFDQTSNFQTKLTPYEIFLLVMAVHFHDVGNMYGRDGHEERIGPVMAEIGALTIGWHEKVLIQQIAACHGGTVDGSKDTIQRLPGEKQQDGAATYRPQLIAAIVRLADELADEHSRADTFGLIRPHELLPTCLLFQKYAEALSVSIRLVSGQIALKFMLQADDLKQPFKKHAKDGKTINVYLLDEIYARTLKTYHEMVYCQRYMRELETHLHEVRVEINVFTHKHNPRPVEQMHYTIGDFEYPQHVGVGPEALKFLSRDFRSLPQGSNLAKKLKTATLKSLKQ